MSADPKQVHVSTAEVCRYDRPPGLGLRLLALFTRVLPRAKGAFPRLIGSTIGNRWTCHVRVAPDVALAVSPASLDFFVQIMNSGEWEAPVRDAITAEIDRVGNRGVLYDVGANYGAIAIPIAHITGADVFAFEPQPEASRCIAISARLNGLTNVRVFPHAIGAFSGTASLQMTRNSLHAHISAITTSESLKVDMYSIDDILRQANIVPPSVIKIDVEGGEYDVIMGARQTVAEHRPSVIFEVNQAALDRGYDGADIREALTDLAPYNFRHLTPHDILATAPRRGG